MDAPLRLNRRSALPSVITDVTHLMRAASPASTASGLKATHQPHVVLVTTVRLPTTARLALELYKAGATVSVVAPSRHPVEALRCLADLTGHSVWAPFRLLERTLKRLRPDAVIPCDEQTVRDLQEVHRRSQDRGIRDLLESSLGNPTNFPIITSRNLLLSVARDLDVRVPDSMALATEDAVQECLDVHQTPIVLKADGSWAGFGVRVVSNPALVHEAWSEMRRPPSFYMALRALLMEGDAIYVRSWLRHERPTLSAQSYVDGRPANIGVVCRRGEVLASICAEAVATVSTTGPSTVTRIIQNQEMVEAASRIVRALGLSGFIGFDFMIENATGHSYLIEMNPRVTPICTIPLGPGQDLPEAFTAALAGRPEHARPPRTTSDVIAYFPDTWELDPANRFLHTVFHDVPWEEPALVRRLMQPELRDRYWALRQLRRARQLFQQRRGTDL
ncbi:MAG: ATP-grasp domain-containing protein [Acetobacteraceae bacterium]|nr:ATP-grasp domain-containing protein [Pseudomonadota bacterium]